jgi:peroxiredoxin
MTLALNPGQKIEVGIVFRIKDGVHISANVSDLFANKRIVLFMGPAPFSRLDTEQALAYEQASKEILSKNIDLVMGIYVQDAFVVKKFEEQTQTDANSSNVELYGDGDGFFVKSNYLTHDFTHHGLGTRSGRWAMILNNGVIEYVVCDDHTTIKDTSADSILKQLKNET